MEELIQKAIDEYNALKEKLGKQPSSREFFKVFSKRRLYEAIEGGNAYSKLQDLAGDTDMAEWRTYEEVTRFLLNKFSEKFELSKVEGKQILVGASTEWRVDAKGIREGSESIVIIEARRHTKSKQNQEQLGALAFRIHDVGADGGIIVSPLGLQSGAKKVADANNIVSVQIDANSTVEGFAMKFFGDLYIGVPCAEIKLTGHAPTVVVSESKKA